MHSFSQAVFTNYLLPSDHQLLADVLFKLPALDQLFCPNEQDKGAVGRAEHTVDLVDADVAVFCCFSGGQRHFEVSGDGEDVVHGKFSFRGA